MYSRTQARLNGTAIDFMLSLRAQYRTGIAVYSQALAPPENPKILYADFLAGPVALLNDKVAEVRIDRLQKIPQFAEILLPQAGSQTECFGMPELPVIRINDRLHLLHFPPAVLSPPGCG